MTTTTTISRKIDVDFAAQLDDFFADYDYAGIASDFVDEVTLIAVRLLPSGSGVGVANDGSITVSYEHADDAADLDWDEICGAVDLNAILLRHDRA